MLGIKIDRLVRSGQIYAHAIPARSWGGVTNDLLADFLIRILFSFLFIVPLKAIFESFNAAA